jgi:hypothetical protein
LPKKRKIRNNTHMYKEISTRRYNHTILFHSLISTSHEHYFQVTILFTTGNTLTLLKTISPNWLAVCKKLKLDPCISPYTNITSKWIKDLNIRPQTLKLIQERVGTTLELVGIG